MSSEWGHHRQPALGCPLQDVAKVSHLQRCLTRFLDPPAPHFWVMVGGPHHQGLPRACYRAAVPAIAQQCLLEGPAGPPASHLSKPPQMTSKAIPTPRSVLSFPRVWCFAVKSRFPEACRKERCEQALLGSGMLGDGCCTAL